MIIVSAGTFLLPWTYTITFNLRNDYGHSAIKNLVWRSEHFGKLKKSIAFGAGTILLHAANIPPPKGFQSLANTSSLLLLIGVTLVTIFSIRHILELNILVTEAGILSRLKERHNLGKFGNIEEFALFAVMSNSDRSERNNEELYTWAIHAFYDLTISKERRTEFFSRILLNYKSDPKTLRKLLANGIDLTSELFKSIGKSEAPSQSDLIQLWTILMISLELNDHENIKRFWGNSFFQSHAEEFIAFDHAQEFMVQFCGAIISHGEFKLLRWCFEYTNSSFGGTYLLPNSSSEILSYSSKFRHERLKIPTILFSNNLYGGIISVDAITKHSIEALSLLFIRQMMNKDCQFSPPNIGEQFNSYELEDFAHEVEQIIATIPCLLSEKSKYDALEKLGCNCGINRKATPEALLKALNELKESLEIRSQQKRSTEPLSNDLKEKFKNEVIRDFNTRLEAQEIESKNEEQGTKKTHFIFIENREIFNPNNNRTTYMYFEETISQYMNHTIWSKVLLKLNKLTSTKHRVDAVNLGDFLKTKKEELDDYTFIVPDSAYLRSDNEGYNFERANIFLEERINGSGARLIHAPSVAGQYPFPIYLIKSKNAKIAQSRLTAESIKMIDKLDENTSDEAIIIGDTTKTRNAHYICIDVYWELELTTDDKVIQLTPIERGNMNESSTISLN